MKEIKKKLKINSTVWPLKKNTLNSWAYWNSAFTSEECDKIIKIGNKNILTKASIFKGTDTKTRDSSISWIYPNKDVNWIFERITDIIVNLNKDYFKFDLYGFIEGLQFTHYKSPGGKYTKHVDEGAAFVRKLSLSIQLSDSDSYKGGDLLLHLEETPVILPREKGKLIAFPSYSLHEVKSVTKGERYSLVAWITGPRFK